MDTQAEVSANNTNSPGGALIEKSIHKTDASPTLGHHIRIKNVSDSILIYKVKRKPQLPGNWRADPNPWYIWPDSDVDVTIYDDTAVDRCSGDYTVLLAPIRVSALMKEPSLTELWERIEKNSAGRNATISVRYGNNDNLGVTQPASSGGKQSVVGEPPATPPASINHDRAPEKDPEKPKRTCGFWPFCN